MIPLNHSCRGPLGADCSGVRHDRTTVAATEMTLRRTRSEDRASSSSGRQAGLADRSALANRTCKSDLHRTSSYDSRRPAHPALSLSLSLSLFRAPHFRFLLFAARISAARPFPAGTRGWIAESSPRTRTLICPHECAILAKCSCRAVRRLYF